MIQDDTAAAAGAGGTWEGSASAAALVLLTARCTACRRPHVRSEPAKSRPCPFCGNRLLTHHTMTTTEGAA